MKKPIALFFALSASLALGSMVPACGGDDDTTGSGGAGGSTGGKGGSGGSTGGTGGTTGGSGGGGTGGTAGKGGTAGMPGDAGPDAFAPIVCGTKTCHADTSGLPLAPCCAPGETDTCGFDVLGTCLTTTPGTPDPLCRDQPSPIPGIPGITGCCRPNGLCGGTTGAPIGCNDFSMLGLPAVPCGPDAAPPPPPDSGPGDATPPPPDSGPADTSNDGATDTGTSDTGTGDTGTGDGSTDAPAEGGGSDGAVDGNNDSAG